MQADVLVALGAEASDLRRTLARAVAASSQEVVDLARALVAEPSHYPPGDTHSVARRIEAMLEGTDVEITRYSTLPHVMNLVVRVRGMTPGRRLVFNGHLDIFPLVDADRWSADPKGEVRDGKLYGLGVSDMKGGIAAIVFALRRLAALRDTLPGDARTDRFPSVSQICHNRAICSEGAIRSSGRQESFRFPHALARKGSPRVVSNRAPDAEAYHAPDVRIQRLHPSDCHRA